MRTVLLILVLAVTGLCCACPKQNDAERLKDAAAQSAPGHLPAETTEAAPEKPTAQQVKPVPPSPAEPIKAKVKLEFPEQVQLVEAQLAVMNNGDADSYVNFIAADAPKREVLLNDFKALTEQGLTYQLYGFDAKTVADGWVKGPLVIMARASDGTATRYTYDYTFKRGADKVWKVYDMIATGVEKLGPTGE
jgi:hypothetical protein